jgi:hypothetical protein
MFGTVASCQILRLCADGCQYSATGSRETISFLYMGTKTLDQHPLGINLDEVAPPQWMENPPTAKKAQLLLPRQGKLPKPEMRKSAAPDYSYAPLMKIQFPRAHREIKRLLSESEHSRYLVGFDRLRVFKTWSACNDRCIEVHLTPEKAGPPNDATSGFHLFTRDGTDVIFSVLGDEIRKIEMITFAPAIRDTLVSLRPEPWVGPDGSFVWE